MYENVPSTFLARKTRFLMKIDFYTKAVLTVIAGALLWNCVQNAIFPRTVTAQAEGPQRVIIVGTDGSAAGVTKGGQLRTANY